MKAGPAAGQSAAGYPAAGRPAGRCPVVRQIGPEQATERRVTHPDLPLAKFPGEERDRHRNLTR